MSDELSREELEAINKAKDELLASIAHDINNPVNGMIGLTESIRTGAYGNIPESFSGPLAHLQATTSRLKYLAEQILSYAKQDKLAPIKRVPIKLKDYFQKLLEQFQYDIHMKYLEASYIDSGLMIETDLNLLNQIMNNLLGNAIKYTQQGFIRLIAQDLQNKAFAITVQDSGIGISTTMQNNVFKPFYRTKEVEQENFVGVGLGLYLVKTATEHLHGIVIIDSEESKGSQFTVVMPYKDPIPEEELESLWLARENQSGADAQYTALKITDKEKKEELTHQQQMLMQSADKETILIVDDDPLNREVLCNYLKKEYNILLANDGASCLELMESNNIDLVLLDLMLPYMSGYEVLQQISKPEENLYLPIIVMSGKQTPEAISKAYECGAHDYISKPFHRDELTARVLTHIRLRRREIDFEESVRERTRQLQKFIRQFSALARMAPTGIFQAKPNGECLYVNDRWCEYSGLGVKDFLGMSWMKALHSEDVRRVHSDWLTATREKTEFRGEFRFEMPDGKIRWLMCIATPVQSDGDDNIKTHYIGTITDVTDRREIEERLLTLAQNDQLTGLANRSLFQDRLDQTFLRARRNQELVGLIFLDLDGFKMINDTLGHDMGDLLLQEVGRRLEHCVRKSDTIARLGGDEFTILLQSVAKNTDVAAIAEKILKSLRQPIVLGGAEHFVSASIGIAIDDPAKVDAATLVKQADIAMYRAKEQGRNNYQYFTPELNEVVHKRMQLGNSLHRALTRDEFIVFYQPQVEVATGRVIGSEALLRWNHPEWGLVSPLDFIPILEDNGLIIPVSQWVIRTACKQTKELQDEKLLGEHTHVAVNLSPREFRGNNLVKSMKEALEETQICPDDLWVEITESLLISDHHGTKETLFKLKDMGLHVALDDFGTGYSSLSYLKKFPIDVVKIDRTFVKDVLDNQDDAAITAAIISLAHQLNLKVVAEGVEDNKILEFLKNKECDNYQGYLFSKPIDGKQFGELLKAS